mmetsp:Transcript_2869/g.4165  ORF Transcript_2869/g.4165 Transcript_2869/m.4165 type:complete len:268 (+) Transcript_2869:284-1087(+)|eukprot:CAMPEP_0184489818 /NCGR_PEP_ID=MMETSP0113_2-20130426/16437_1 /TAXON_ID=91329 /ORGANISM="Norrisiella sphaerica, Strain BC52" /LENGTH=267 /DNA_ID=CAMNT_0026873449 /DNA_START=235 /DNA_END=1038 /DNA_ORIENTATION=-
MASEADLDLTDVGRKLGKHIAGNRDDPTVLDILTNLHDRPLKLGQLAKSGVSKTVYKMSKGDTNEEIKSLSGKLVKKWARLLKDQKSKKAEGKGKKKDEQEKVSVKLTGDSTRDSVRTCLLKEFGSTEYAARKAEEVEDAMLNEFKEPSSAGYKKFYRTLMSNIRDKNNPECKHRILQGRIPSEKLVQMKSYDFASNHLKKQRQKQEKEASDATKSDYDKLAMASDRFKCGKCKKRMVTYYQIQIRSSDEPMTIKITCLNCGNRWNQ